MQDKAKTRDAKKEEAKLTCKHCGETDIKQSAKFCNKCGKLMDSVAYAISMMDEVFVDAEQANGQPVSFQVKVGESFSTSWISAICTYRGLLRALYVSRTAADKDVNVTVIRRAHGGPPNPAWTETPEYALTDRLIAYLKVVAGLQMYMMDDGLAVLAEEVAKIEPNLCSIMDIDKIWSEPLVVLGIEFRRKPANMVDSLKLINDLRRSLNTLSVGLKTGVSSNSMFMTLLGVKDADNNGSVGSVSG